ncbi:methyltransferase [Nocardia sp. NPDC050175]|uniref:methyltransferase n=1 Tax=Nocardia sp. NPDC050175 TaxID=3364317 RepID=UPI0037AD1957
MVTEQPKTSPLPKIPPLPLLRAVDRFRSLLTAALRRTAPAPVALLDIVQGGFLMQTLCAAAELGVADALAEGPLRLDELAARVGARADALARLLRPLLAEGIFTRHGDRYQLTSLAEPLRADVPVSIRGILQFYGSAQHRAMWSQLAEAVRTGDPVAEQVLGMPLFDFTRKDREFGEMFDAAQTSASELTLLPTLAAYDFAQYGTIVDIAGGHGRLLIELLTRAPRSRGILFDMPEVVAEVPTRLAALGLADRCTVAGGSFFESVPTGGDAYILKHVLHDWYDADAGRILRTVRAAISDSAKLLLIEMVLPSDNRRQFGKLIDLEMLAVVGGRERTEQDFRTLLSANGFELIRRVETAAPDNILEARPI